ncbi:Uncharacterized protein Rs2_35344 [Raphanus sativus]|nr:Uncharacterized protein Rs2_35344 [Raphanus sativus]
MDSVSLSGSLGKDKILAEKDEPSKARRSSNAAVEEKKKFSSGLDHQASKVVVLKLSVYYHCRGFLSSARKYRRKNVFTQFSLYFTNQDAKSSKKLKVEKSDIPTSIKQDYSQDLFIRNYRKISCSATPHLLTSFLRHVAPPYSATEASPCPPPQTPTFSVSLSSTYSHVDHCNSLHLHRRNSSHHSDFVVHSSFSIEAPSQITPHLPIQHRNTVTDHPTPARNIF